MYLYNISVCHVCAERERETCKSRTEMGMYVNEISDKNKMGGLMLRSVWELKSRERGK